MSAVMVEIPRNPRRALAKLSGSARGWEDVAMGVSKIRKRVGDRKIPDVMTQALLTYLWSDHRECYDMVLNHLCDHLGRDAQRKRWAGWYNWLRPLVGMALEESDSALHCPNCNATGWTEVVGGNRACPVCDGRGFFPWPLSQRARTFGKHEGAWKDRWEPRYRFVQEEIDRIERKGLSKLRSHLAPMIQ